MGRKVIYNKALKLEIVRRYMNGESPSYLANEYGLPKFYDSKIRKWTKRFIVFGEKHLMKQIKTKNIKRN